MTRGDGALNSEHSFAPGRWGRAIAGVLCLYLLCASALAGEKIVERLTIFAPAAETSGWGRTAVAIRDALRDERLVGNVDIVYAPGAGGLIGLAQFIGSRKGDPSVAFVGGRTILGATLYNRSRVSLKDTTPIARLVGTAIVIAVPTSSPIGNLGDLIEAIRINPALVKWVGGSAGSTDELIVRELMAALGTSRDDISFEAVPGGGNEVVKRLSSGQYTAAASSIEEFAEFAERGDLRIIAVSSSQRLPGITAPTLVEYGVNVSYDDWRGVFAPPGLSKDQLALLHRLFTALARSPAWARQLAAHSWQNSYMPSADFTAFTDAEAARTLQRLNAQASPGISFDQLARIVGRHYRWTIAAGILSGLLLAVVVLQRTFSQRVLTTLRSNLDSANTETKRISEELEKSLAHAAEHIHAEFDRWKLTEAEQEIGWMLLKGLSFREIAAARGRTERTVRQQARSIYAKSKLDNRADLAAFFLEDFCFGHSPDQAAPLPQHYVSSKVEGTQA